MLGKNKKYIVLLPLFTIFFKWGIIFQIYSNFDTELKILLNFNDLNYFPFIISLSDLDLSPTFNEYLNTKKLISFPQASIFFHAFFFKIFGLISYIILEIVFVILTYVVIYYLLKEFKIKDNAIIIAILTFFSLPILLNFILEEYNFFNNFKDQFFFYHLINFRYPRPLVTNVFFFLFLVCLFKFYKSQIPSKLIYFVFGVLLAALLQSFIYLFFLAAFSFLIILIFKIYNGKFFFKKNINNFLIFIFSIIFFSLPFIFQIYFAEPNYSQRMGLFPLNLYVKKKIIYETLMHFINLKYFFFLFFLGSFYLFLKKYNSNMVHFYKIYLLIFFLSITIPFFFIVLSPYAIWYKHFFDVKNLIILLGMLIIYTIFIDILLNRIKVRNFFLYTTFFALLSVNFIYYKNLTTKYFLDNKIYFSDLREILKHSNSYKIKKKLNIFSNSNFINSFFILKRQNILFPQGFHVALNDDQLEILMINSLKSAGLNEVNFSSFIENQISWRSSNPIGQITGYKYQFNSFYTYFDLNDYQENEIKFLMRNKFFLSESIALSISAKKKLLKKFTNHEIKDNIKPDLLIIDKKNIIDFVPSKQYLEIVNNKSFTLFYLRNNF